MIRKVVVMEPNDYQPAHGNTGFRALDNLWQESYVAS